MQRPEEISEESRMPSFPPPPPPPQDGDQRGPGPMNQEPAPPNNNSTDQSNNQNNNSQPSNKAEEEGPVSFDGGVNELKMNLRNMQNDHEEKLRVVKRGMDKWKQITIPVLRVLHWEKNWYAAALIGGNTVFFYLLRYCNMSVLSLLFGLGAVLALMDGMLPMLSKAFLEKQNWSPEDDKKFDQLCSCLLEMWDYAHESMGSLRNLRKQMPHLFTVGLCGLCLFGAVVSSKFNTAGSMYFLTTGMLLLPGICANKQRLTKMRVEVENALAHSAKGRVPAGKQQDAKREPPPPPVF
ncbi:hypothetical protein RvY_00028 [Ramazzottius varieornatus]|uniref:RETREG1-3/ARL6IP-like N-terminal reticulon-homology domain-containing protein n=1 Tax=Ramazzottius varieornatus TaxID=947166 RepID=A0A1D1UHL6_RAMVA|nr:hypothetical protein RvY_00028 [Ramazzottius varieornatus]